MCVCVHLLCLFACQRYACVHTHEHKERWQDHYIKLEQYNLCSYNFPQFEMQNIFLLPRYLSFDYSFINMIYLVKKNFSNVLRFDVNVPGGRVYKESSFTEAGIFFNTCMLSKLNE